MINFTQEEIILLNRLNFLLLTNHPSYQFTLDVALIKPIIKAKIPEMLGEIAAEKRRKSLSNEI